MLLEISTRHTPADDLGYLLHKHPGRVQTFKLAFGDAHVFYPEATANRCVAALLIDVDPVTLVRSNLSIRGCEISQRFPGRLTRRGGASEAPARP